MVKIVNAIAFILLATQFATLRAESSSYDAYSIPHDKSREAGCRKAVIEARPGEIVEFHAHVVNSILHYQYEVEEHGKNWIVICNAETQKLIKNEQEE